MYITKRLLFNHLFIYLRIINKMITTMSLILLFILKCSHRINKSKSMNKILFSTIRLNLTSLESHVNVEQIAIALRWFLMHLKLPMATKKMKSHKEIKIIKILIRNCFLRSLLTAQSTIHTLNNILTRNKFEK